MKIWWCKSTNKNYLNINRKQEKKYYENSGIEKWIDTTIEYKKTQKYKNTNTKNWKIQIKLKQ